LGCYEEDYVWPDVIMFSGVISRCELGYLSGMTLSFIQQKHSKTGIIHNLINIIMLLLIPLFSDVSSRYVIDQ
jgi:hypothetical protein